MGWEMSQMVCVQVLLFLPKGVDMSTVSQTQLNDIARLLNSRPRKTLGWITPDQAMADEIAAFAKRVALDS